MRSRMAALAALGLFFASCATPIRLPEEFVQLRDSGDGYRAVTADDARVWVRTMDDPSEGGVEFWLETLKRDFVDRRGYEFLDDGDVKNAEGDSGRWLELRANHGGERIDYLIALWARDRWFVGGKSLRIVEFAARPEAYEKRVDAVREALGTVSW